LIDPSTVRREGLSWSHRTQLLAACVTKEPRTIASWGRPISAFSTFWIEGDLLPTPLISVVIPARDEEGRIGSAVAAVHSSLINGGFNPEIVVVDDGSRDETGQEAIQASTGRTVRLLTHAHPQGKGAAIASGLRVSAGELVGFIDADLEYPAEALPQMAQMIYKTVARRPAWSQSGPETSGTSSTA
jgi:cellulose synthase/poly-beta-1,6-N-acetylglucosamine synthase-like glycosyltransferase